MTKDEALKMALEALEKERPYLGPMPSLTSKAITGIKAALAQPAQEPMDDVREFLAARLTCWHRLTQKESDELVTLFEVKPPQRHWVGLTEDEWTYYTTYVYAEILNEIEQLLQEKNT